MKRLLLTLLLFPLLSVSLEAGPIVGETSTYAREQGRDQLFFYVSSGNGTGQIEYICTADAGTETSALKWQIRKFTYDSSNRISEILWASGTDDFKKSCDDRASYSY